MKNVTDPAEWELYLFFNSIRSGFFSPWLHRICENISWSIIHMVLPLPGIKPRWNARLAICMGERKVRADLKVVSVRAHLDESCFFSRTSAYYRGEGKHQMDERREGFLVCHNSAPPPLLLSPSPDSYTLLYGSKMELWQRHTESQQHLTRSVCVVLKCPPSFNFMQI